MTSKYGPWGIVAGGSDGVGAAFAHEMASRGINVVLVARRVPVLEASADEIRAKHGVEVRTVALDLSAAGALSELVRATSDLEVGRFVYNAGSDDSSVAFLDKDLGTHLELVHRNCASVLEAAYRFGAEGLWVEWRTSGVDVLALVLGRTDTPSMRRVFDANGQSYGELADPDDVAAEALDHLADGPTWIYGSKDPTGGSPFGPLNRRDAVLAMSRGATAHE